MPDWNTCQKKKKKRRKEEEKRIENILKTDNTRTKGATDGERQVWFVHGQSSIECKLILE